MDLPHKSLRTVVHLRTIDAELDRGFGVFERSVRKVGLIEEILGNFSGFLLLVVFILGAGGEERLQIIDLNRFMNFLFILKIIAFFQLKEFIISFLGHIINIFALTF